MSELQIHRERPCHSGNYAKGRTGGVKYLVIHYVGALGGAEANAKYYGSTPGIGASAHYFVGHGPAAGIGASAHYFVGHGPAAEIWASVPEADTAWHVGSKKYVHPTCRNDNAIGVEMCCHQDATGTWYFDPETVDAAVALGRDIIQRYNIPPERVLRHYDVTGKICPAPFVHDQAAWEKFKARLFAPETKTEGGENTVNGAENNNEPAEWAKVAWDKAKAKKGRDGKTILDGARPWDGITRQEVAVILDRLGLLEG